METILYKLMTQQLPHQTQQTKLPSPS